MSNKQTDVFNEHQEENKKELSISEVARMGGNAVKKKYGKGYFKELIKKRWKK